MTTLDSIYMEDGSFFYIERIVKLWRKHLLTMKTIKFNLISTLSIVPRTTENMFRFISFSFTYFYLKELSHEIGSGHA